MSLDYKGIPDFSRQRDLSTQNLSKDRLNAFLDKPIVTDVTKEDVLFNSLARVYLKGEALKLAISQMDPAGFVPVEDEATVKVSIQRQYTGSNTSAITFGMFKDACEYLSSRAASLDEDFILKFNAIDPKLQSSVIITKHKSISNNGDDWISCFLEQLSSFAGMLIAGKMADLSFLISPQLDIDTNGGTGSFKSWGAQGSAIAICLLIELGLTQLEFKKLYGKSPHIPVEVTTQLDIYANDPAEREKVLTAAGFDYSAFKNNQKFNDQKAIKEYSLNYIEKNQDQLNYDHWISYLHVVDSQGVVKNNLAMAPTFSKRWNEYFSSGPESITSTNTDITTIVDNEAVVSSALSFSLASALAHYISDITEETDTSYNYIYQGLRYQVDPALICCLVWYLGPMDTRSLKDISNVLRIASLGLHSHLKELVSYFGESVLNTLLHMLSNYLCQILNNVVRKTYNSFLKVPSSHLDQSVTQCVGLNVLFNLTGLSLEFVVQYLGQMLQELTGFVKKLCKRSKSHAITVANRRTIQTLRMMLDKIIVEIDSVQSLCNINNQSSTQINDNLADRTFDFVANILPSAFPVLNMTEEDRRKHFIDISPIPLEKLGINIPGTNSVGIDFDPTVTVPECGQDSGAIKNIELGKQFANFLRGT